MCDQNAIFPGQCRKNYRAFTSPRPQSQRFEGILRNLKEKSPRRKSIFFLACTALLLMIINQLRSVQHQTSLLLTTIHMGPIWDSTASIAAAEQKSKDPASHKSITKRVTETSKVGATSLRHYRTRILQSKKSLVLHLLESTSNQTERTSKDASDRIHQEVYWNMLEKLIAGVASSSTPSNRSTSSFFQDSVCGVGPGQGIEEDAGYKLLVDKIRLTPREGDLVEDFERQFMDDTTRNEDDHRRTRSSSSVRLFCGVYTYSARRFQVQIQAWSWGWKCDGFIAFSNETLPDFGIHSISFDGEESYVNLWQKVRAIWVYIYENFGDQFDYFHLGGDDMYLLVENMRDFLEARHQNIPPRGKMSTKFSSSFAENKTDYFDKAFMGQWLPAREMIAGGPGYTLNAAALEALVLYGLPNCSSTLTAPYEDRLISKCFVQYLGMSGNQTDTRDESTGEQRYHDAAPSMLYSFRSANHNPYGKRGSYQSRIAASWEEQSHPTLPNHPPVGPKHALDAAASTSVSFHNIHNPYYVARIHSILFPGTCPMDSPLFQGLSLHTPSSL